MKNSMVEQILLLIEENRTLRRELEEWRVEAERLAKELERVFEYGKAWDPDFKEKFYRSRAQASNWGYQPMLGNVAKDFKYPIPEEMLGREQAHRRTISDIFSGHCSPGKVEVEPKENFECEGPPESEYPPGDDRS